MVLAVVVESRELCERRPLKGRYHGFDQYGYVLVESKLYYYPSCYPSAYKGSKSFLDYLPN